MSDIEKMKTLLTLMQQRAKVEGKAEDFKAFCVQIQKAKEGRV